MRLPVDSEDAGETPALPAYKAIILRLIEQGKAARRAGLSLNDIRTRVLADEINSVLREIRPQEFLDWVKDDREYSFFYYDAQQSGVCAKPPEVVASILETIALDALE
jgi:hypothetical protein